MLHRVLKRANIHTVRFRALRYTIETLALQSGEGYKTVSRLLSHFSAGFSLDTCAHVTTPAQREAARTMGSVLGQ